MKGLRFAEPVVYVHHYANRPRQGSLSIRAQDILAAEYVVLLKNETGFALKPYRREPGTADEQEEFRRVLDRGDVALPEVAEGYYVLVQEGEVWRMEPRRREDIRRERPNHPWRDGQEIRRTR